VACPPVLRKQNSQKKRKKEKKEEIIISPKVISLGNPCPGTGRPPALLSLFLSTILHT
jgi:hypothetical protein